MTRRSPGWGIALTAGRWCVFGVALLAPAGCRGRTSPAVPTYAPVPVTARELLEAVREARGKVVLVNVWATWCDPCRREFPALLRVQRELAARDFKLILVSADFADQRSKVLQFLTQEGVDFSTYLKAEEDESFINTLDSRWSGALPATFLFDRSGRLRDFWEGEASYATLAGKVKGLLGGGPELGAEGGSP